MNMDPTHPILTDDELAIAARALDVHRQALVNKINNRLGPDDYAERGKTLSEIQDSSSASSKMKVAQNARFAEQAK